MQWKWDRLFMWLFVVFALAALAGRDWWNALDAAFIASLFWRLVDLQKDNLRKETLGRILMRERGWKV